VLCTHHLVSLARPSNSIRSKRCRKSCRKREGAESVAAAGVLQQQDTEAGTEAAAAAAVAVAVARAGTAYSCASSIRNFTHYAVATSVARPQQSELKEAGKIEKKNKQKAKKGKR